MSRFPLPLTPGARLGPYEIINLLGAGGMGEVYRARDSRLGRQVAIKVLPASSPSFREMLARFEREARTISNLEHPHICPIYDVGTQDEVHFLVMQYLEGETLDTRIRRGSLPFDEVLALARAIAEGLAYAHKLGVIHRDLKPSNVMLTATGAKILDFGLATSPDSLPDELTRTSVGATNQESVPGTVAFMAPETLVGNPADVRTDVWAFGVTLYQAAVGRLPFRGGTLFELTTAILRDALEPLPDRFPPWFGAIVSRCLEKGRERRYESASAILDDLNRIPTTELKPHIGPSRTRRWVLVGAAAVTIAVAGVVARKTTRQGAPPTATHMAGIAVLPFTNLASDQSQEYVADGMTDAIIAELGQIRSLRTISRQSVMRYKRAATPLPQIARELGVDAVITGSVIRSREALRVTVALVQASPERQLWSRTYDRRFGDLLTLSGEVAQATVQHVSATVTPQEQAQLMKARPINPDAQQAYLMGRFFWNKRTKTDNERAIQEFRRAITLDPSAALAYAGLADSFVVAWDQGYVAQEDAYREAKANAAKALQLDDNIAEAHASLGAVYTFTLLWQAAESEFRRALERNPGYTTAHQWYAHNLSVLGRHAQAVAEATRAVELDPLSPVQNAFLGQCLYLAGDYAAAVKQLRKALDLDANFQVAHILLGRTYLEQRQYALALRELEQANKLDGAVAGQLGHAYALAGDTTAASRVLHRLLTLAKRTYVAPDDIGLVYLGLGDRVRAVDWFVKAYQEREAVVMSFAADPRLAPISTDPRFQALLQKSGLTFNPGRAPPAAAQR